MRPRKSISRHMPRQAVAGLLFITPALLLFLSFKLPSLLLVIIYSLTDYKILGTPRFNGIENFISIFLDPKFIHSLKITLYYTGASTVILLPLSLFLAILISNHTRMNSVYQAIFFMPYMLALFTVALIWTLIYHPYGLMNTILSPFMHTRIRWLISRTHALLAVIIMRTWWGVGYYMLLFTAGLRSIPAEYYEAARIDGAGQPTCFRFITLPLLKPMLLFVTVISIIFAFQTVDIFLIMTRGGPVDATTVLALLTYKTGLQYFDIARGCAMSLVLLLILFVFTLVQLRIFRGEIKY